ncbi:MAG TPA: hypothetical protein VMS56_07120, partial [Thermoanaerobaculia bacterium]|nr:hypothetical protein [Thermoanaerobaculia bacterium]
RDVIARGVFTSIADLARKLMRYIRKHNDQPKPIKWTYTDITRRITGSPALQDTSREPDVTNRRRGRRSRLP